MPCGPGGHHPLPPGLGVDDGDVDGVRLASIGADGDGPSVRRRRIARKVMLDAVARAHRKVFEPAIRTAHVHLPPLGAPPVGGDKESPCAAAPSMANAVRGSPPATGISQTTAGPSLGETNASVDPSGENANGAGPE